MLAILILVGVVIYCFYRRDSTDSSATTSTKGSTSGRKRRNHCSKAIKNKSDNAPNMCGSLERQERQSKGPNTSGHGSLRSPLVKQQQPVKPDLKGQSSFTKQPNANTMVSFDSRAVYTRMVPSRAQTGSKRTFVSRDVSNFRKVLA